MLSFFSLVRAATIVLALLAGCGDDLGERLQSGQVLPLLGLQGRWVGSVAPVSPSCGQVTQGLMSIGEKGFGFDPFQSTTVIQGIVDKDGHLTGSLARQGGERQGRSIAFDGMANRGSANDDTISGTLSSGRCQWTVTLHRG